MSFQVYAVGGYMALVFEQARDLEWLAANSRSNPRMAWSSSRSDMMLERMIDDDGAGAGKIDVTFWQDKMDCLF